MPGGGGVLAAVTSLVQTVEVHVHRADPRRRWAHLASTVMDVAAWLCRNNRRQHAAAQSLSNIDGVVIARVLGDAFCGGARTVTCRDGYRTCHHPGSTTRARRHRAPYDHRGTANRSSHEAMNPDDTATTGPRSRAARVVFSPIAVASVTDHHEGGVFIEHAMSMGNSTGIATCPECQPPVGG